MMYDGYDHNSGGGFAWVFMLLIMILAVLGVVGLVHYLNRSAHSANQEDSALEILKGRYAKGDIEKKEFDEKRKDLKS